jgi:hypothetical protein
VEYYQDTTQEVRFMRVELGEIYSQFKSEREIFMTWIIGYQEETLMGLIAYKDMMKWSKKSHQVLEKIEYIREIQKGRGEEEHGIRTLTNESLVRFKTTTRVLGTIGDRDTMENARNMGRMSQELEQHKSEDEEPLIPKIRHTQRLCQPAHNS